MYRPIIRVLIIYTIEDAIDSSCMLLAICGVRKVAFLVQTEDAKNAILFLNNLNGTIIKTYTILQRGYGSVIIKGDDMDDGLYLYTLLIDILY